MSWIYIIIFFIAALISGTIELVTNDKAEDHFHMTYKKRITYEIISAVAMCFKTLYCFALTITLVGLIF